MLPTWLIEMRSAAVDAGLPAPPARQSQWGFRYLAPPIEGIDVELQIQGRNETVLQVIESRRGLPEIVQRARRRPPHMMSFPYPYWLQNSTLISKRIRIPLD